MAPLTDSTSYDVEPGDTGSCQIKSSSGTSGPKYLTFGPISLCSSLNQARENASANWSGFSWNLLEIFLYSGSLIIAISAVVIIVGTLIEASSGSGAISSGSGLPGVHWCAPAGLFSSTQSFSYLNSMSK